MRALAFLVLATGTLFAQEYTFRTYGNAEGLNNLAVRQIFQDHVGFIWVSTEDGIYRYDGERFEAFGPPQGIPVTSAAALGDAPDGSLLVGGDFGLYHLSGNRFEKVSVSFKSISWAQGIQSDGKGKTFLGTDAGLVEMSLSQGKAGFAERRIARASGSSGPGAYGVLVEGDVIWYGCGLELCRMDANGTRVFGKESGLPGSEVLVIRKDGSGNLWVRAKNEGVFTLPAGQARFRRPDTPISENAIGGGLSVDTDGRILLPSPDGLLIHDEKGWQKIDRAAGLHGVVYATLEDRQHSLWIGMAGRGLVQWRGYQEWESYSTASGLGSDIVYEILPQSHGVLWVATEGGLVRGQRGATGIRWKKVQGLSGFPVHAVRAAPDGDLWIGSEMHGAARFDPRTGEVEWFGDRQCLLGRAAYGLRFDRQQRLWVATEAGLFMAAPPYRKFSRIAELPIERVWAVAEGNDGTIWAGGAGGLFAYTAGHWKNWARKDGLSNQEVLSLGTGANGTMWIGYRFGGGIDRVKLKDGALEVEKAVQRPGTNGLVYFLDLDASGRLWAGTEHGVDVWTGSHWSHYDMGDGLVWDDCNLNAFAAEADGTVWIGTSAGLSRFRPHPHPALQGRLEVVFTRLVLGKTDVSTQGEASSGVHANSLVARYSALNATQQNQTLFRYRLVGANSTWTETTQRELQFAQLAPGSYRLEIEAQDGDGVWSDHGVEFSFKVLTPWNASWWFLSLCVLLPVSGAGGVVRVRILGAQRRERERQQLEVAHDEIRNLAFYDPLTGLPNRRLLLNRLQQLGALSARNSRKRALLFVDLDDFRTLNDTQGHQIGDLMLQEAASRLIASVRESDTVARLGGDEYVVILEDLSESPEESAAQAKAVCGEILMAISQPYVLNGHECRSTSSIGITVFGGRQEDTDKVLQQAEIAMFQAKTAGRNTMSFFAPALQAAVNARAEIEGDLRLAIEAKQFLLYYQPQVERGRLIGAEALIRWKHPRHGIVGPDTFIPLAEETGLILPLGNWVLENACHQIAAWANRKETAHVTISVNISAKQLRQPNFVENVLKTLAISGADPHKLELELTESMLLDNVEDVIAKMTQLKLHGLRFSLDDFGTGYSSLSYLKRLPLDQLKIDRSFVRDLITDASDRAIAHAIVSLGRTMGLSVIAEGVETKEQEELLTDLGCHSYQGFLFSRPLPIEEFQLLALATEGPADHGDREIRHGAEHLEDTVRTANSIAAD
jgi:diguanylate cyclase (GGDEF)-like protein